MPRRFAALIALPLAAMALATPLTAQTGSAPADSATTAAVDAAYYGLYDAISGGVDIQAMAVNGADSIFDGLVRNEPRMAQVAKRNPGMRDEFRTIAVPYLKVWMDRSTRVMRQRVAVRLSNYLSPAEAAEIGQFYGSPVGRKLMRTVSRNMSFDNTVDQAVQSPGSGQVTPVSQADLDVSVSTGIAKLLPTLTPAERDEFLRFSKKPAYAKLHLIPKAMEGVEQPGIDEMSTAEERDGFAKAVRGLFERAMAN